MIFSDIELHFYEGGSMVIKIDMTQLCQIRLTDQQYEDLSGIAILM